MCHRELEALRFMPLTERRSKATGYEWHALTGGIPRGRVTNRVNICALLTE